MADPRGDEGAGMRTHSASSLALGMQCKRAWALRYLAGIREPEVPWLAIREAREVPLSKRGVDPSERYFAELDGRWVPVSSGQRSKALGTHVHLYAEWWVSGAASDDPRSSFYIDWQSLPGQILHSMLPHLPERGSIAPGNVEATVAFQVDGVSFRGKVDVLDRPPARKSKWPGGGGGVWDHKTTRDIVAYALRPDGVEGPKLSEHLQPAIYVTGYAAEAGLPDEAYVTCRWTYGETDKVRRSLPVVQPVNVGAARARVRQAAAFARELEAIPDVPSAPANTLACDDYGGCWYRREGHCSERRRWGLIALHQERKARET